MLLPEDIICTWAATMKPKVRVHSTALILEEQRLQTNTPSKQCAGRTSATTDGHQRVVCQNVSTEDGSEEHDACLSAACEPGICAAICAKATGALTQTEDAQEKSRKGIQG